jgi:hypothetical protein
VPNNKYHSQQPGPLGQHQMYGADYNAGVATQPLTLQTEDGATTYTLFVSSGKLYIKAGVPANATDGTVVGTQT